MFLPTSGNVPHIVGGQELATEVHRGEEDVGGSYIDSQAALDAYPHSAQAGI